MKADIANPISDFVYRGIHADSDLLDGFRREGGGFHKDLPPFSEGRCVADVMAPTGFLLAIFYQHDQVVDGLLLTIGLDFKGNAYGICGKAPTGDQEFRIDPAVDIGGKLHVEPDCLFGFIPGDRHFAGTVFPPVLRLLRADEQRRVGNFCELDHRQGEPADGAAVECSAEPEAIAAGMGTCRKSEENFPGLEGGEFHCRGQTGECAAFDGHFAAFLLGAEVDDLQFHGAFLFGGRHDQDRPVAVERKFVVRNDSQNNALVDFALPGARTADSDRRCFDRDGSGDPAEVGRISCGGDRYGAVLRLHLLRGAEDIGQEKRSIG